MAEGAPDSLDSIMRDILKPKREDLSLGSIMGEIVGQGPAEEPSQPEQPEQPTEPGWGKVVAGGLGRGGMAVAQTASRGLPYTSPAVALWQAGKVVSRPIAEAITGQPAPPDVVDAAVQPSSEAAEYWHERRKASEAESLPTGGGAGATAKRVVAGMAEIIPRLAAEAAVGGPVLPFFDMLATSAEDAYTSGREEGLEGPKLAAHVAANAGITAAVQAATMKLGAGLLPALARKSGWQGWGTYGKKVLADATTNISSMVADGVIREGERRLAGMEARPWSDVVRDAAINGAAFAIYGGVHELARAKSSSRKDVAAAAKVAPTEMPEGLRTQAERESARTAAEAMDRQGLDALRAAVAEEVGRAEGAGKEVETPSGGEAVGQGEEGRIRVRDVAQDRVETKPGAPVGQPKTWQQMGEEIPARLQAGVDILAPVADVPVPKAGTLAPVRNWLRKWLSPSGGMPEGAHGQEVKWHGAMNEIQEGLRLDVQEIERALGILTPERAAAVKAVLEGAPVPEGMPLQAVAAAAKMRANIDALSSQLIDSGILSEPLKAIVESNKGVYLHRSYRVFDDPAWAEKVPAEVKARAESLIRAENPGASDAEIRGIMAHLLYVGKEADSPMAWLAKSKTARKDLSMLVRRKEIAPAIRALWGEYEDPVVNYAKSVTKMANAMATHKHLTALRELGMGKWLSDKPIVNDYGELKTQFSSEGNKAVSPLDGLWTTPEIKEAFERSFNHRTLPPLLRGVLAASSMAKYSKTVLSPVTHVRNFMGNVLLYVGQGHVPDGKLAAAARAALTEVGKMPDAQAREYYLKLVRLGVVGESVNANELRSVIKDSAGAFGKGFDATARRRAMKRLGELPQRAYGAEDDFWKVAAWEGEKARLRDALGKDAPESQIEQMAADIVRETMPSWSETPPILKEIRKVPIAAPFVNFPYQIVRSFVNTWRRIHAELNDPKLRKIGAQRMAGQVVALGLPVAATMASRYFSGISRDDDDDMRRFMPYWSKDSEILMLGRDEDNNVKYVDLGFTDPYVYLKGAGYAALRGENPERAALDAAATFFRPLYNEDLFVGAAMQVHANKTQSGGEIYNPADSFEVQLGKVLAHMWNSVEPGAIGQGKRMLKGIKGEVSPAGQPYSAGREALSLTTGTRISELNIERSLRFALVRRAEAMDNAERIHRTAIARKGVPGAESPEAAAIRSEDARRQAWTDMANDVQAARRLGMTVRKIRKVLAEARISEADANRLLSGMYSSYRPHRK